MSTDIIIKIVIP